MQPSDSARFGSPRSELLTIVRLFDVRHHGGSLADR
jgi:hypothetical protein